MTEREKQLTELVEKQAEIIKVQALRIEALEHKVDQLTRKLYGKSTEQLDKDQLQLELDGVKKLEAASPETEEVELAAQSSNANSNKRKRKRPSLPENLPVETEVIIPLEVQANPEGYEKIGEKITKRLDIEPAKLSIKETIRPRYKAKETQKIITSPLPPALLEKSILSPSLLSYILCSKYCDHLPLYRQEQIFARRYELHIARSTLCEWVNLAAEYLEPLYKLLAQQLRQSSSLQIDETPITYLTDDGSKEGRIWVYTNQSIGVLYDWHNNRKNTCLDSILLNTTGSNKSQFKGVIQCDGYEAYSTWAKKHPDVSIAGCWVHARRKFYEAKAHGQDVYKVLSHIGKLYEADKNYRNWLAQSHHPPEAIIYYRKRYSRPIYKQLGQLLRQLQKTNNTTKHPFGAAISYTLNQWEKLGRTISCSPYDLDNNAAERSVRPLKLGMKNWMFIGADQAGWRSAVIYTMIENVKREGKDPYAYLKWVFERLPSMTNQDDLSTLMPQAWLARQSQKRTTQQQAV